MSSRSSLDDMKLQFGQAWYILPTSCYLDSFKILICFFGQFSLLFFLEGMNKKNKKLKHWKPCARAFLFFVGVLETHLKTKLSLDRSTILPPFFCRDIFLGGKNTQKEISKTATWKWLPTNDLSSILFLIGSKVPPKKRESPWGWFSYTKKRPIQFEFSHKTFYE